jgi:hypothetical protein
MRVKARVVGNTLVMEKGVPLPEGTEVDIVLRAVGDAQAGTWDVSDEDWAELQTAMDEAESQDGVPAEVVLAELRAMK